MDRLLLMSEVAELLGLPVRTLEHWRLQGRGPKSAKIGRRVKYRERDVQAWVDAQFERSGTPAAS